MGFINFQNERRIKLHVYNNINPAAVVTYSYIFLGRNKALRIEAPSPIIIRIKAGKEMFFYFLANIAGASPSSAKFINTLVTANNEPTNVEKPLKLIPHLK